MIVLLTRGDQVWLRKVDEKNKTLDYRGMLKLYRQQTQVAVKRAGSTDNDFFDFLHDLSSIRTNEIYDAETKLALHKRVLWFDLRTVAGVQQQGPR